jgi:hypothetical protein
VVLGYGDNGYAFLVATSGQLALSQVGVGGVFSTNKISDGAFHHVAVTRNAGSVIFYLDGVAEPAQFYNATFQFTSSIAIGCVGSGDPAGNFLGVIDELDVFNRALAATEVQAIYDAGNAGKCDSVAPTITSQPAGQTVTVGGTAIFNVTASGTQPLTYQWSFGLSNIPAATNATLTLTNVQLNQAGTYSVLVSNSTTLTALSTNAVLTVNPPPSIVQAASVTATSGLLTVPIDLIAQGTENALGFSFTFNTARLTFISVTLGAGANGAGNPIVNPNQIGKGEVGVALALPANASFPAGTNEVVDVNFFVSPVTSQTATPITFGDSPIPRSVSNPQPVILSSIFVNGSETIPVLGVEADVSPRTNGDGVITLADWVQEGRFVAGLDTVSNASEFQRADCAPRSTLGDGALTVADWVQAGRYFAALDPLTAAGGPTQSADGGFSLVRFLTPGPVPLVSGRTLAVLNTNAQAGQPVQVSVQLTSQGNENGLEFSVGFDPSVLAFTGAVAGAGASGALLNINTNHAASGTVGIVQILNPDSTFASGTPEVVKLSFQVASGAGGTANVTFGVSPLPQAVSDASANDLTASTSFVNGTVSITPITRPVLTGSPSKGGLILSWPVSAAGFNLESSPDLSPTNWSAVSATLTTNGATVIVTNAAGGSRLFYRLHHP